MPADSCLAVAYRDVSDIKDNYWAKYLVNFMSDVQYLFPSMKPLNKPLTKSNGLVLLQNKHSYIGFEKKKGVVKLFLTRRDDGSQSTSKLGEAWNSQAAKKFVNLFNEISDKDKVPLFVRDVVYRTLGGREVRYRREPFDANLQIRCSCGCGVFEDYSPQRVHYNQDGIAFPNHL